MRDVCLATIANHLKSLRVKRGLSVKEVAEAIVCDRTQLHHVEAGEQLGVRMLLDLAQFYGTTAEEIVHGNGKSKKRRVA